MHLWTITSEFSNDTCTATVEHTRKVDVGHQHEDLQNLRIKNLENISNVLYNTMSQST